MKILVIGGAGFIGSALVNALIEQGHDVVALDLDPNPSAATIQGDVRDRNFILNTVTAFEAIYYLAGYTSDAFNLNPQVGISLELLGVGNALEAAALNNVKRFIYVSSFHVYSGLDSSLVVNEETPLLSQRMTIFGATKFLIERFIQHICEEKRIAWQCCRLDSVFGSHERCTSLIYYFLKKGLNGNRIEIWGSGKRVNQFSYVDDIALALVQSLETDLQILNFCAPTRISVHDLAELLTAKYNFSFSFRLDKKEKPTMPFVDSTRARSIIRWKTTELDIAIEKVWGLMLTYQTQLAVV